jgi:PKD repeat protein
VDSTFIDVTVYPVPYPDFELDTTSGCSPLQVTASNTTNDPGGYSYFWDFGNGDTTSSKIPLPVDYANKDTATYVYDVTLKVSNLNCSDSVVRKVTIYPEVTASFSADVTAGCHPLTVNFTNNSNNADVYYWDFGNGITSGVGDPKNKFKNETASDVIFTVQLRGESYEECFHDTTLEITVYPQPNAQFDLDDIQKDYPDTTFYITNKTTYLTNWNYEWDYGDNSTSSRFDPFYPHDYTGWDTFDIQMIAHSNNCRDTMVRRLIINPPSPIAMFTYNKDTGCIPLTIQFTNTSMYENQVAWDFGDGKSSLDENPSHIYDDYGLYTVKLTVEGDGGSDYSYHVVEAYRLPIIDFETNPDTVMLPQAILYTSNKSYYAERFLWDFGDGDTSWLVHPEHQYQDPPNTWYTITLTGWTEHNCMAVDSIVNAVFVRGEGRIKYPNVFYPNISGPTGGNLSGISNFDNTVFRPYRDGVVEYHLQIFNRWGELVFETQDLNQGWDGYYKGRLARQGVYVWRVDGKYSNGLPFEKKGDVTLLYKKN